jgi:hypothetical protein
MKAAACTSILRPMAAMTMQDSHMNARTGVVCDWLASFSLQPDGAHVALVIAIPGRARPLSLQTLVCLDAGTDPEVAVRKYAQHVIDDSDFSALA